METLKFTAPSPADTHPCREIREKNALLFSTLLDVHARSQALLQGRPYDRCKVDPLRLTAPVFYLRRPVCSTPLRKICVSKAYGLGLVGRSCAPLALCVFCVSRIRKIINN